MQWVVDLEEAPAGIVSVAIMERCTRPQSHWKVWSLTLACGMSRLSQKKLETGIFSEQSGDSHVCCMSSLDYKSLAGQQNSILRRVGDLLNPVRTLHWYMGLCGGGLTIPAIAAGKLPYLVRRGLGPPPLPTKQVRYCAPVSHSNLRMWNNK